MRYQHAAGTGSQPGAATQRDADRDSALRQLRQCLQGRCAFLPEVRYIVFCTRRTSVDQHYRGRWHCRHDTDAGLFGTGNGTGNGTGIDTGTGTDTDCNGVCRSIHVDCTNSRSGNSRSRGIVRFVHSGASAGQAAAGGDDRRGRRAGRRDRRRCVLHASSRCEGRCRIRLHRPVAGSGRCPGACARSCAGSCARACGDGRGAGHT